MAGTRQPKRSTMRLYGEIQRVSSDDERMVWGYASTDRIAADGQIITTDALRGALDDYMAFANIREMHQLSAVGITREAEVDDAGLYIGAWVQDDDAWDKVKTRVYRGFSIGARVTTRDPIDSKVITAITLNEISLVDRPADPGAVFDVFRAAGNEQDDIMTTASTGPNTDLDKPAASEGAERAAAPTAAPEATVIEDVASSTAATAVDEPGGATPVTPAVIDEDPVARAIAAAASAQATLSSALDQATSTDLTPAAALPGLEIRRGLSTVAQLGWMLAEIAYLVSDAELEAAIEGDDSPVPDKLRSALVELAKAYRAMSDEEVAELLKNVDVDVSLENGIIQLAAAGSDVERAAGLVIGSETGTRLQAALNGLITRGWKPNVERAVEALTSERDKLLRALGDATEQMTARAEQALAFRTEVENRFAKLEAMPLPAKTAGPAATVSGAAVTRAVGKGEDASAQTTGPSLSQDDVKRALDAMTAEDRAVLLTKAALARPYHVSR